jgi:hypothetical protein
MAKDISLLGASYPDVPAVDLPQTGGGTARFYDVSDTTATAADVVSGKAFYLADGSKTSGSIPTQAGETVTPTRSEQTVVAAGKYTLGAVKVAAIPDTYYTQAEALELFYPVGSIHVSTSATAPDFGGTWTEIKLPLTVGDIENGSRSYESGAGSGSLHFWLRTA